MIASARGASRSIQYWALDGAGIVGFAVLRPEDVDHAGPIGVPPVVNDSDAHHGLQAMSALLSVRSSAMLALQ